MVRCVVILTITTALALANAVTSDGSGNRPCAPLAVAGTAAQAPPVGPGGESGDSQERDERRGPPMQGPSDRDWRGDRGGFRLTAESREHVLAVIADLQPLDDEKRARLADMSYDELREFLAEQGGMILGLARLRETQPELYDLRVADMKVLRRIQEQLQKVRTAREENDQDTLVAAETELRALVSEQIDLRFAIREREIGALERRVVSMREELERERSQPREELVERRLEMFESAESRDWRRNGAGDQAPSDNDRGDGLGDDRPDR